MVVLIAIALLSAAYFSGPLLVVIILVSTLVYLALRGIYRSMDLNKDGEVNFDDLRYLFGCDQVGAKSPEESQQQARSFMEKRLHDVWSALEEQFVLLSCPYRPVRKKLIADGSGSGVTNISAT